MNRLRLKRLSDSALVLLLVLLAFAPFVPALSGGFVYDDNVAIRENPVVTGDFSLPHIFDTGFWGGTEGDTVGSYRPLTVLTFAVDWRLGGGDPWVFHLTNLLLHCLCTVSCFLVLRHRFGRGVGLCVAAVFAVHALHTENVDGIVARADIIATILGLWTWHLAQSPRRSRLLAVGPAFLACLLAKETGVAFLGLIVAEEILKLRGDDKRPLRQRLIVIAVLLAALGAYLTMRVNAIGRISPVVSTQSNPLADVDDVGPHVYTASALVTKTTELLVFPAVLSVDYSYAEILPYHHAGHREVLTGLILWVLLPAVALLYHRRRPKVATGILLLLAAYVPISNLIITVPTIFAERLLYLPSLGAIIAAVCALEPLWSKPRVRRYLVAALVVVLAGHTARSAVRSYDWRSPRAIFTAATKASPASARNWFNLAVAALEDDEPAEAAGYLAESLQIYDRQPIAYAFLGVALDKLGQPQRASETMLHGSALDPQCKLCAFNLVSLYAKYGKFERARQALERYRAAHGDPATIEQLTERISALEARAIEEGLIPGPRNQP